MEARAVVGVEATVRSGPAGRPQMAIYDWAEFDRFTRPIYPEIDGLFSPGTPRSFLMGVKLVDQREFQVALALCTRRIEGQSHRVMRGSLIE